MNRFGWILVKDKFWEAYETNRLIEEFQKQDIDIVFFYYHNNGDDCCY